MPQWLAERTDEQLPPVLVRTYWGEHQRDATQKYAEEANLLIPRGYSVVGQSWADTKTSAGDIVAYGVLGFGNKGGTLTVTYSRTVPGTPNLAPGPR
jgi:hypothetical protein